MFRLPLLTIFTLFGISLYAQDGNYSLGARNAALSGAAITLADSWSVFNNPGAFGSVQESSVFVSYQNRYNIPGFHVIGGGFAYHHSFFNAGVKYFKFGDDLFSQQSAGIALANRFQMVSLGLGINLIQSSAEGLESRRGVAFELGGVAEITKKISFGAHVYNVKHRELYPTTMKAGITLNPIESLKLNIEAEKQLDVREKVKIGLEYRIISKLYLRTGLNLQGDKLNQNHAKSAFGFGFTPAAFIIDYAFSNEARLGAIHELSLSYNVKKQ